MKIITLDEVYDIWYKLPLERYLNFTPLNISNKYSLQNFYFSQFKDFASFVDFFKESNYRVY